MDPQTLSRQLRTAQTPDLSRRRGIIGLSMVGAAAGAIVTLYQTGIVKHLPDPPLGIFDSDAVDASTYAYKRGNAPDAPAMLVTYGLTAWLASAGGRDRARRHPWLPVALLAKTVVDSATALQLAREEWSTNEKLCAYCQAATVASIASAALAVPEAVKGLRRLLGR